MAVTESSKVNLRVAINDSFNLSGLQDCFRAVNKYAIFFLVEGDSPFLNLEIDIKRFVFELLKQRVRSVVEGSRSRKLKTF